MTDKRRRDSDSAHLWPNDVFTPEIMGLIRAYELSEAPVAMVSRELDVLWANAAAIKLNPGLSMRDGVTQLLTGYTAEKVVSGTDGNTPLTLISNPASLTIHLTPMGYGYFANFAPYVSSGTALHPQGQQLLISAVSGQLRMPLTNMFASIASLRQLNIADDYPELEDFISSINENAYKMLRATTNITQYFKYFSPEIEQNPSRINLNDLLKNLLGAAAMITGAVGIPLSYHIPEEPIYIAADEQPLVTALLQVLSNSCRFTRDDNAINVTLSRKANSAAITVTDAGLGIPEHVADKVFEPFFSFDHTGLPFAGVGLGLTISRAILMHMGGRIAISSVVDEGTTVAITLPCVDDNDLKLSTPQPTVDYLRDRFSLLHIILSDACGCPAP